MPTLSLKGSRKVSKGKIKLGVATLLVILVALSTVGTASAASKTLANGSILMEFQEAKRVDNTIREITYDYGDSIKVELIYPATSQSIQYLDIMDRDDGNNRLKRYSLAEIGIDSVNIPATDYEPATNFTLYLYAGATGEVLDTSQMGWTITAEIIEPIISLSLDNPSNQIAKGDLVNFEGTITATSYNWTLTGPYNSYNFYNVADNATVSGTQTLGTYSTSAKVTACDHDIDVTISTDDILKWAGGTTGTYKFEVWNDAYPDTTESIEFSITDVSISSEANKDTVKIGQDLTISGTTNIAETNNSYDDAGIGSNKVFIAVYNDTSAEMDDFVDAFTEDIDENGNFSKNITFELGWDMDITYQIQVIALSGYDDSKSFTDEKEWAANYEDWADYYDDDSVYVDVDNPEVKFQMDDTTFTRGESDISFKGTSSLPANSSVYIPKSDLEHFIEVTVWTSTPSGYPAMRGIVGSDGSWDTYDVNIKDDASIGSYTVEASIFGPNGCELDDDSVTIKIEKQRLNASLDRFVVPQGGSMTLTGNATVSTIYIFASEFGLLENVTEVPSDTVYVRAWYDMNVTVDNGSFTKTLDVKNNADTGNYQLYVYAPASEYIRIAEDPQKVFQFSITERGDTINCDSVLDLRDSVYLAKHVVGLPGCGETCANADINSDGVVDLEDAIYLAKHVVGMSGYGGI